MCPEIATKVLAEASTMNSRLNALALKAKDDLATDKKGQAILEYGILFVAVGLGLVFAVTRLKDTISKKLDEAGSEIQGISSKGKNS